jgi:hypothetical protein
MTIQAAKLAAQTFMEEFVFKAWQFVRGVELERQHSRQIKWENSFPDSQFGL